MEQIPALRPERSIRCCDKVTGPSAAARHAGGSPDNNKNANECFISCLSFCETAELMAQLS